jgi:hypothetical protein
VDTQELDRALLATPEDVRLSRSERQALSELLRETQRGCAAVRNAVEHARRIGATPVLLTRAISDEEASVRVVTMGSSSGERVADRLHPPSRLRRSGLAAR